jgi:hypothetical protein
MQFGEHHVGRALGRASWDLDGPWYVLDDRGNTVRAGRLDERPDADAQIFRGRYRPEILKWLDWERLFWVTDADRRLFVALLSASRDRLSMVYPAIEWHLILLDTDPNRVVTAELERRSIRVHPIRSILPVWRVGHPDYTIAGDGHPSRRYNEVLGRWVQGLLESGP